MDNSLDFIIHHVFLPPKLPQKDDGGAVEAAILTGELLMRDPRPYRLTASLPDTGFCMPARAKVPHGPCLTARSARPRGPKSRTGSALRPGSARPRGKSWLSCMLGVTSERVVDLVWCLAYRSN
ncbi:MAG: hypothetical protein M4579_007293, partial [Chaenotheca gracillima]